jgi:hypothetical protein
MESSFQRFRQVIDTAAIFEPVRDLEISTPRGRVSIRFVPGDSVKHEFLEDVDGRSGPQVDGGVLNG